MLLDIGVTEPLKDGFGGFDFVLERDGICYRRSSCNDLEATVTTCVFLPAIRAGETVLTRLTFLPL